MYLRLAKSFAVLPTGYGKSLEIYLLPLLVASGILLIGSGIIQLRAVIFSNACLVSSLELGHFHYSLPDAQTLQLSRCRSGFPG